MTKYTLVLASSNIGKLTEIRQLLAHLPLELLPQSEFGLQPADETGLSFVENALIKARHASQAIGLPTLADDSGLVVPALGGQPGTHSARYAGLNADAAANNARLQAAMHNLQGTNRRAWFYTSLCLMGHAADPVPLLCQGRFDGQIAEKPIGHGGFGYDPMMLLPDGTSMAQLSPQVKNRISHRGQAMAGLVAQLPAWLEHLSTSGS